MSTAWLLKMNATDGELPDAAYRNAVSVRRFADFTRYTFRDESILVIAFDGKVTSYEPSDEVRI